MSLLGKFIESIQVNLYNVGFREVVTPFLFDGRVDDQTILILNHSAELRVGKDNVAVKPGSFLFLPKGQGAYFRIGKQRAQLNNIVSGFSSDEHRRQYLKEITGLKSWDKNEEIVVVVSMSLTLYNTIPFFSFVGMPAMSI